MPVYTLLWKALLCLPVLSAPGGYPPHCPGPSFILVNDLPLVPVSGNFVQTCMLSIVCCHCLPSTSASLSLSSTSNPSRDLLFPNTDLINIPSSWYHMHLPWSRPSPSLLLSEYNCICPANRFFCASHVPSSLCSAAQMEMSLLLSLPALQRTQSHPLPQHSEHWPLFPGTPASLCLHCDCRLLPQRSVQVFRPPTLFVCLRCPSHLCLPGEPLSSSKPSHQR